MGSDIIAVGGGGFSNDSEPGLDAYILAQAGVPRPKIGFIGTASGDSETYLGKFYDRFGGLMCEPTHLPLFRRTPNVRDWVQAQDVIFVGGGNTRSMLATWATWDLGAHLKEALARGIVLSGVSAGAICWFDSGVTDSLEGELTAMSCLGFIPGSCCPHYLEDANRKPSFEALILSGTMVPGIAIDDGACVHFSGGKPKAVVSASLKASAYQVGIADGTINSVTLEGVDHINVAD